MGNQEQMLKDITTIDFVLVDLMLFLDTHPFDRSAMEYYNHYSRLKNQMVREFSQKFYPLTLDLADSNREWRWGMTPLPWEGVCG